MDTRNHSVVKTTLGFILFGIFFFISGCAVSNKIQKPVLPSYDDAILSLADHLLPELKKYKQKSFYIYNGDIHKGESRELSKRFIEDLGTRLVNHGVRIKKKERVTWAKVTNRTFGVKCEEFLESLASDFFIEFTLRECSESIDCMVAGIQIIKKSSNDIQYTAKKKFRLVGNVAKWNRMRHRYASARGSMENPFTDYHEAANHLVGRLACIAKNLLTEDDAMRIIVGKTGHTPPDMALAFSQAVSYYGLEQVIIPDKWLPLALKAGDQFELGIYKKKHRELFATANVVLALDMMKTNNQTMMLKAQLLTLGSMAIRKNNRIKTLKAGMVFPYCVASGYAKYLPLKQHMVRTDIGKNAHAKKTIHVPGQKHREIILREKKQRHLKKIFPLKKTIRENAEVPHMVLIPAGIYHIPDDLMPWFWNPNKKEIFIRKNFYIMAKEVSIKHFLDFIRESSPETQRHNAERWSGYKPTQPVSNVSWHEAVAYADWLRKKTDMNFSLPTRSQWMAACIRFANPMNAAIREKKRRTRAATHFRKHVVNLLGNLREWSADSCNGRGHYTLGEDTLTLRSAVENRRRKNDWSCVCYTHPYFTIGFRLVRTDDF
jgi:formylglycine-generating enzyme required for sulfatase activity